MKKTSILLVLLSVSTLQAMDRIATIVHEKIQEYSIKKHKKQHLRQWFACTTENQAIQFQLIFKPLFNNSSELINAVNERGNTLLHHIICTYSEPSEDILELAEYLIRQGTHLSRRNQEGLTVEQLLIANNAYDCLYHYTNV
jgi:hypothetical protein